MASIHRETRIARTPEEVWVAVRDVGHCERLAPGFVTGCTLEAGAAVKRNVTFANGMTARELIVDVDDAARRLAWSAQSPRLTHHNASLQLFDEAGSCRAVRIADLLPDEVAPAIAGMIEAGLAAMKRGLEG